MEERFLWAKSRGQILQQIRRYNQRARDFPSSQEASRQLLEVARVSKLAENFLRIEGELFDREVAKLLAQCHTKEAELRDITKQTKSLLLKEESPAQRLDLHGQAVRSRLEGRLQQADSQLQEQLQKSKFLQKKWSEVRWVQRKCRGQQWQLQEQRRRLNLRMQIERLDQEIQAEQKLEKDLRSCLCD